MGLLFALLVFLPGEIKLIRSVELNASQASVWSIISKPSLLNLWRKGIVTVELLDEFTWVEEDEHDRRVIFQITEQIEKKKMVTQILSEDCPVKGSLTFEIHEAGPNTVLKITENRKAPNLFVRITERFFKDRNAKFNKYIKSLRASLEKAG